MSKKQGFSENRDANSMWSTVLTCTGVSGMMKMTGIRRNAISGVS
jgi:hypothetical protein